jgi:3-methyladenine DNA glycosylase AlkD
MMFEGNTGFISVDSVLDRLRGMANPDNVAGMSRYGINPYNTLGISIYQLRPLAKEIGRNHPLALELWQSGIHEARILASYIADPKLMSDAMIEAWAQDFDSWDVVDQVCGLFEETPFAYQKVAEWSLRPEEFVKRAAFALIAGLAVHDKHATDARFEALLVIILREANDPRNYVRKAVNWALRNIGKRNRYLNARAIETAEQIQRLGSATSRWIASDAIRELRSEKVQSRINLKSAV